MPSKAIEDNSAFLFLFTHVFIVGSDTAAHSVWHTSSQVGQHTRRNAGPGPFQLPDQSSDVRRGLLIELLLQDAP